MIDKELEALASELKNLRPLGSIDREQLMFRAGRESLRVQQRRWIATSGALAAILVVVSTALIAHLQQPPHQRVKVVLVERQAPVSKTAEPQRAAPAVDDMTEPQAPPLAYLELRQKVLRGGVENLPALPRTPESVEPSSEPKTVLALHLSGRPGSLLQWLTGQAGEIE